MSVDLVGSGPAVAAVEAALDDVGADVSRRALDDLDTPDLAVVVGQAGDTVFGRANERALEEDLRWFAVELGGVGGFPVTNAAVAGFGPESGCYECLSGRVSSNLDPDADPAAAPPAHTARFAGAIAGREGAQYMAEGNVQFGRVIEVPYRTRRFLPLPNCACAGPQEATVDRTHRDRDLEEALSRAELAIDDRTGIVQEVGEAESFPLPYYLAHACDTAGFSDVTAGRDAAGVASGWDAAFMKALGEAFERYSAGIYRVDDFETASPGDLSNTVDPFAFVCASEADPDAELQWVPGETLSTGEKVFLPAEFVHYPPPSRQFRPPTTTGLGLGNSGIEALLAGLYEVIERDAAVLSWYSTFEPLGLAVEDSGFETLADRARSEALSVTATLVTQDVDVPVVVTAVHREEWPAFAVGSDADLDAASAARSALAEALQNWMELRSMGREDAQDASGAIGRYADSPPEAGSLVDPDATVPAASVGPDDPPADEAELAAVLDTLGEADLEAYATQTTTRDVEVMGFEAVRVVVPGAQPLFFGDAYFGDRVESVPRELGFEPDLERVHHPFP
jgi:ribosomal protein S12 methylthiotransferase accessory factor